MNPKWSMPSLLALTFVAMTTLMASAGELAYEIVRSSVNAGGAMSSFGGEYELASTIGPPNGGGLAGDDYRITGGFWYEIAAGDCTADGYVDMFEHEEFSSCLTGPGAAEQFDTCLCFDIDRSGSIDLLDYASVQAAFTGP